MGCTAFLRVLARRRRLRRSNSDLGTFVVDEIVQCCLQLPVRKLGDKILPVHAIGNLLP
jgi:hypothetical protein